MFIGDKGILISASDYNESPVIYKDGKKIDNPKTDHLAPMRRKNTH